MAATCSGVVPFSCGHGQPQPRSLHVGWGSRTPLGPTPPLGSLSPTSAHRVEEVGLGAQREQAQAGLQVARPHARVQLLRRRELVTGRSVPTAKGGSLSPHPTLLRSLAVTPSSSRQGSLWTKASIWYLARMNSDLVGLWVGSGFWGEEGAPSQR